MRCLSMQRRRGRVEHTFILSPWVDGDGSASTSYNETPPRLQPERHKAVAISGPPIKAATFLLPDDHHQRADVALKSSIFSWLILSSLQISCFFK